MMPYEDMLSSIRTEYPSLELATETSSDDNTARMWQVPGHMGRVGFISSMSDHFCESCTRLRLLADGNLKVT